MPAAHPHAPHHYETDGAIAVSRVTRDVVYENAAQTLRVKLDTRRGALFTSNYEVPGRYTRWDMGFCDPPLVVTSTGHAMRIDALNGRGAVLLEPMRAALAALSEVADIQRDANALHLRITPSQKPFTEEMRTRQPSVFSALRALIALFRSDEDPHLGLYGAFGYDLTFQFDPIELKLPRPADQRDMVLYLPDEILIVDHHAGHARVHAYDFAVGSADTHGLKRSGETRVYTPAQKLGAARDHAPGAYARMVDKAKEHFRRGDLFEVVPGQTFREICLKSPAALSERLVRMNPAPYGFLINLGQNEYLVGASPEMFVRVSGDRRIETCPISGTISRGADPIADAEQIRTLLNSSKDEAELTMCSDVDRNDKSRVCEPGSVRVIGRRQIEMYSRLIHTVDHIEGRLRADMDALDGFLSHTWAVTVTGAPKLWAMRFLEENETSPRAWYGGAVGVVHFNGDLNTGLTLRTIRVKDGVAEVRAGATLLYDSDPAAEEAETELKASAMIAAIKGANSSQSDVQDARKKLPAVKVLFVDHEDSFVHTLAAYFRQAGADVTTFRAPVTEAMVKAADPALIVLSPGPGRPKDFQLAATIELARKNNTPVFGVCLGLQGITEFFGGTLDQLDVPVHGKPSEITLGQSQLFEGLPGEISVGRYHSLIADPKTLPACLRVTATTADGVIMGLEHVSEPITAVQFHPDSIMTLAGDHGLKIVENVLRLARARLPQG